jgi:hypothetical protein
MIVTVAAIVVLRFFWPAVLMGFVLMGIDSPGTMLAAMVGLVILGAVALRERLPH